MRMLITFQSKTHKTKHLEGRRVKTNALILRQTISLLCLQRNIESTTRSACLTCARSRTVPLSKTQLIHKTSMFPNTQRALNIAHTPQISSWNIECCLCCGGKKKGATPKHNMIRQVYDSSSATMGYTRACCWDKQRKTKNPHRSRRGISSVCARARARVCLCARASSSAHVLLSLIIVCIHHNKQLHNSALQNKRTTLCMLKNRWPYKWWTRQTLRGYHSVGNSLICFHTWHCVKQVHCMWKTAQTNQKKKKRYAKHSHTSRSRTPQSRTPPKGIEVRHKATPQSRRLQHLNVVRPLLFTKYIHKEESYELARQQWTARRGNNQEKIGYEKTKAIRRK